jgi:lycopene cyclase domain-containing protein
MSYLTFLVVFLVLPLALVSWLTQRRASRGRPLAALAVAALALHVVLAVVYTTPWDNYLVATRVWWYDPAQVLGVTLGWVPLEEYLFFVLQVLLLGLVLMWLLDRHRPASPMVDSSRLCVVATSTMALLWMASVGILAAGWAPGRYLALILVWALPPIALQLAVGADILWHYRRVAGATLAGATLYLAAADSLAIGREVWMIDPAQSLGLKLGGILPVEELLFFFVTSALVVFGLTLTVAPETAARWLRKSWACHQLAEAATGELLLFTDADIRHHPLRLRRRGWRRWLPELDAGPRTPSPSLPSASGTDSTAAPAPAARAGPPAACGLEAWPGTDRGYAPPPASHAAPLG